MNLRRLYGWGGGESYRYFVVAQKGTKERPACVRTIYCSFLIASLTITITRWTNAETKKNRRRCFIGGYNVRGREGEKSRPPTS